MGRIKEHYHDTIEEQSRYTDDSNYIKWITEKRVLSPCCYKPIKWLNDILICSECKTVIDDMR